MHVWCACVCCVCLCTESVLEFSMLPKLNILLLFFFFSLSFHTLKMYVKYINVQFVRKRQDGETSILNFFFCFVLLCRWIQPRESIRCLDL